MKTDVKVGITALAIVANTIGLSAVAIEVPNNLDAGSINKANSQQILNRPVQPERTLKGTMQKFEIEERKPVPIGTKGVVMNPEFTVNKIVINGNSVFKDKNLLKITKKLEGKKVSFDELIEACTDITNYYWKKGYITSKAYLAPQKIDNGVVEISIQEGKLGDIDIKGNKWAKDKLIQKILASNGVQKDKPLNIYDLKNAIDDVNSQGFMNGKISVDKNKVSGADEITLDVKDRCPLDFNVTWDNDGQELTGQQRAIMMSSYNNLTGHGDRLYGGSILGNGTVGALGGYSIPVGKKGGQMNFGYSHSGVQYGGDYKDIGLRGKATTYSVSYTRPLYKGRTLRVDGNMGLDITNMKSTIDGLSEPLTSHRLTVLRTGIKARKDDFHGVSLINTNISTGIPLFGATVASHAEGYEDSRFVKFDAGFQRYQILPKNSMGIFRINTQYSPNKMLSSEKMYLGGSNSVRGFEPGLILGDTGFNGSIELRTPIPFFKAILPKKLEGFADKTKLGYFYDYGYAVDMHNTIENRPSNFMQSLGVGVHFPVSKMLQANVDLGVPIGGQIYKTKSARLSFSLSSPLHELWSKNVNNSL